MIAAPSAWTSRRHLLSRLYTRGTGPRGYSSAYADFAGPFQGTNFLVVVDAYSKWPEVFILPSTTTGKTIECLRSLPCKFGYPEQLVSDMDHNSLLRNLLPSCGNAE